MQGPSRTRLTVVAAAFLIWSVTLELYSRPKWGNALAVVDWTSGAALAAAGLVGWARRPHYRTGQLMVALAFVWFFGSLRGAERDPEAYTVGLALQSYAAALFLHLVLTFPEGRARSRIDKALILAAYAVCTALIIGFLFFEPRAHGCDSCRAGLNLLQVTNDPGVYGAVNLSATIAAACVGAGVFWQLLTRWRAASRHARNILRPVYLGGVICFSLLAAAPAIVGIHGQASTSATQRAEVFARDAALAILPLGFLVGLLRTRAGTTPIGRLLWRLNEAPVRTDLRNLLAEALGDPQLELGLWTPALHQYVDPHGAPLALAAESDRAITYVAGHGSPLAVLIHDPVLLENEELIRSVTAAARLAIEREQLQADVRAQLAEVRASRARLVEATDAERRRIERDLHDGAQQRLVALSLQLAVLADEVSAVAPDSALQERLARVQSEAAAAVTELRELASGIHPKVLVDEGLRPALETLVRRSTVPTALNSAPSARLPAPVEACAYFVCAEALVNAAKHAAAEHVVIDAVADAGELTIRVADDGEGGADPEGSGLRGLRDRVEAVGGGLMVSSEPGDGTVIIARIPITSNDTFRDSPEVIPDTS